MEIKFHIRTRSKLHFSYTSHIRVSNTVEVGLFKGVHSTVLLMNSEILHILDGLHVSKSILNTLLVHKSNFDTHRKLSVYTTY